MKVGDHVQVIKHSTFSGCYGVVSELNPISSGMVIGDYSIRLTASANIQHGMYVGMTFIATKEQVTPISDDEYIRAVEDTDTSLVMNT